MTAHEKLALQDEVAALRSEVSQLAQNLAALREDLEKRVAVLESRAKRQRIWPDVHGRLGSRRVTREPR